mgnify:CR=1 FL=1
MKYTVGLQKLNTEEFIQTIIDHKEQIYEVYFSWVDCASGRSMIGGYDGYFDYDLQNIMTEELKRIKNGLRLQSTAIWILPLTYPNRKRIRKPLRQQRMPSRADIRNVFFVWKMKAMQDV